MPDDLTDSQKALLDLVLGEPSGADLRDVLRAADAPDGDKAAVADWLQPGAGAEFR